MKNNNYIVIQGWMVNELKLSGNDLLCYSVVFGFSQDGESEFTGSLSWLSETLNIDKRSVSRILKKLVDLGYIARTDTVVNGVIFPKYKNIVGVDKMSEGVDKMSEGVGKMSLEGVTKCAGGVDKMSTNNNSNIYTNNNIDIYANASHAPEEHNNSNSLITESEANKEKVAPKRKAFQKPTIEEVREYVEQMAYSMVADDFYDYYESNGWKVGKNSMKDWKAAARNWERNEKNFKNKYGNGNGYGFGEIRGIESAVTAKSASDFYGQC